MRADGDRRRLGQQFPPVLAGVGRHRADVPLVEEVLLVVHLRDRRHVDARQRQRAALVQVLQGRRHQLADRREDDRAVDLDGHVRRPLADPLGAHLAGQLAVASAAGDHVDLAPAMQGDLHDDVGAGAEAVDRQLPAVGQVGRA